MVSALVSGSSDPGSSLGRGHRVMFLDKTLNSHSASLHPGVQMGTSELNVGGTLRSTTIPSSEIFLVTHVAMSRIER